jgi:hypothetical protein
VDPIEFSLGCFLGLLDFFGFSSLVSSLVSSVWGGLDSGSSEEKSSMVFSSFLAMIDQSFRLK